MKETMGRLSPLNQEQISFFADNGYLLLRQACSNDLLDIYNLHMYNLAKNQIPDQPDSAEKATFSFRVFNPHLKDSFSLQMLKLPIVRGALAQLMGDEAVGVQSMYFFKEPGSKGQAAHQDYEYIHHEPNTMIAASIAMEKNDQENGCLRVIPGSHKLGPLPHGKVKNILEHADWTTETEGVDLTAEIPVVMEKGISCFSTGIQPGPVVGRGRSIQGRIVRQVHLQAEIGRRRQNDCRQTGRAGRVAEEAE